MFNRTLEPCIHYSTSKKYRYGWSHVSCYITRKVETGYTVERCRSPKQGLTTSRKADQADPGTSILPQLYTVS